MPDGQPALGRSETRDGAIRRYALLRRLGTLGALMVFGGIVAGALVKRAADTAAWLANHPEQKRLVSCGPGSNQLALCFPKRVDQVLVAPDYSSLWFPAIVVGLGIALVVFATIAAVRRRSAS